MVKKLTTASAGFLLNATLDDVTEGRASYTQTGRRKRNRDKAEQRTQEIELQAEKAPRLQAKWLEDERKKTQLPRPGREASEGGAPGEGGIGVGIEDFEGGDGTLGKKKARRMAVLAAKKSREAGKKGNAEKRAHAVAAEALKGKAKKTAMTPAAAELLQRCRRDPAGEQRLLALVAERVSGNPEKELEIFDVFFELHNHGSDATTKNLALLSAVAVFKDLVPGYRIREQTEAEKNQVRSKVVLTMEKHEMTLLQTYRRLLPAIEAAMKRDGPTFANALSALVKAGPDFNYRQRLIHTAVRHANSGDAGVRRAVSEGLQDMVEADQRLEASKELVLAVGHIAQTTAAGKGGTGGLHIELLQVFLRLQVGRAESAALQEDTGAMKDADDETRKGLAESSITQGSAHLEKAEAELLYEVFCVYLRVMRQRHFHGRELIACVLVGLARWGQQVNLELLLEILQELRHAVRDAIKQSDELVALQGLNCALVLLSGPSQALITDATWLETALTQAFALALPSLYSTHSESAEWPPARCYDLAGGTSLQYSRKELAATLEAESVPFLVLRCLDNAMRCPHGFGKASDGVLATLLEALFLLAAGADSFVGMALLREASTLLKKNRRLHTLLDPEGGLFGLGGITDRAVSIAWQLQPLACSLAPAPARIGRGLADVIRGRRALLGDIFSARDAKSWLESEFPQHLVALLEAPKPGSQKVQPTRGAASFCDSPEELRRRIGDCGGF